MSFPNNRPQRLRQNHSLRRLVQENQFALHQLIAPIFVRSGQKIRKEISSMPGVFQLSSDQVLKEVEALQKLSVSTVLLFGIPETKDAQAIQSYSPKGVVQKNLNILKKEFPDMLFISDVCLCSYTSHGHCGIIKSKDAKIDHDGTLKVLQKIALSHAEAGADMVAPSAMMDGQVKAIRESLDQNDFQDLPVMSYSAKFASNFYGPFREAAESPPQFGDRKTYQMDFHNGEEALREIALDLEEGADIVMVKPALAYLDIIRQAKQNFSAPLAAYHVSGEYSMVKAAAQKGWLSEKEIVMEILSASHRAGADLLITYWAKDVAKWLKD